MSEGMSNRLFHRIDYLCAGLAGAISFCVYWLTMAPNVTLLDSGEFLVAAGHFGVAHPTGYPLWTLLSWIFQLLPLGNMAWEVSLFSGICAALAVALCAFMASSFTRWLFGEEYRFIGFISGLTWSLLFAFSQSQWSQAVIVEVYALHSLLVALFLLSLQAYICKPESVFRLLLCFFFLVLAFSNHHLTLVLAPLPFLAVLLLQRRLLADLIIFSLLTASGFYLFFAIASEDSWTLITALRFFFIIAAALIVFLVVRRGQACWTILTFFPVVVALGLLPYAYMPLASQTNPPMNWGYTRSAEGLFYSFNRSQYASSFSEILIRSLGRVTGTSQVIKPNKSVEDDENGVGPLSLRLRSQRWIGFFWQQLVISFTPFSVIAFFAAVFGILRCDLPRRTWIYLLTFAFALAAFLQPILENAEIDLAGWWIQMPYHTYTNLIFALLCSTGTSYLLVLLNREIKRRSAILAAFSPVYAMRLNALIYWSAILLLLPLWTAYLNFPYSSQRNRWFGWQFGYDMLNDLPKNAVVFGGTDPGRFVPTYMIFGESPQSSKWKRDPDFDRQDLYIITQNALGDKFYQYYIRDHYSDKRPIAKGGFEHWLGRNHQYPTEPLILPTYADVKPMISQAIEEAKKDHPDLDKSNYPGITNSTIAKWIFEKNSGKHDFFVEESFPMRWTYNYAIPHGLIYRINKEPLKTLSEEDVSRDRAFWNTYIEKLLAQPGYWDDFDAQRSFSKLRNTTGNIYAYRKMNKDAEYAYQQALQIWPANGEAIVSLSELMWDRGEYEKPIALFEEALRLDPNNRVLFHLARIAVLRRDLQQKISEDKLLFEKNPQNTENVHELLEAYKALGFPKDADKITAQIKDLNPANATLLGLTAAYYLTGKKLDQAKAFSTLAVQVEPTNPELWLLNARVALGNNDKVHATQSALKAIESGGYPIRERIQIDPRYKELRTDSDIKNALRQSVEAQDTP